MKRLLAVGGAMGSALMLGCGGGAAPTSASRTATAASAAIAVAQIPASALFGASAVDFARCLQGAADAACLSGARLTRHAVAGAAATMPGSPLNLSTSSSGSSVMLTWSAPASGDAVTSYVIEAGSAPGLADLANFVTGSTATSFSAGGVGNGTYYVRVRAQNAAGTSAASNESTLIVGSAACTSAPNAPSGLAISSSGSTVTLTWSAPAGGCAPTSYVLQAGASAGASNLANSNVGNTTSYVAGGVGNGTYYVRVRAANAFGQSAGSNEVVVTVTAGAPTPGPGGAGTWRYVLTATVPLPSDPGARSCVAPSVEGTTVVGSNGVFSIPFSGLACSNCSMSGTIAGTILPTSVSGSVTASISGSGCSVQQPTPSPAAMSGMCTAAGCTVFIGPNPASFAVSYTLTRP